MRLDMVWMIKRILEIVVSSKSEMGRSHRIGEECKVKKQAAAFLNRLLRAAAGPFAIFVWKCVRPASLKGLMMCTNGIE